MKIIKIGIILLIIIFLFAGIAQPIKAQSKPNMLLLSSYHPNFPTFFQQIDGLKSELPSSKYNLDIEFMDSKRFSKQEYFDSYYKILKYKLSKLPPYDVVFTSDDNAFNFVLKYQDKLFPNTPIVFFGVNNITNATSQDRNNNVTGIIEATSMKETITLAKTIIPGLSEVVAISDNTTSGDADLALFNKLQVQFPDLKLSALTLKDISWNTLYNNLSKLDRKSCVLLLSAYRDVNEESMTFEDSLNLILQNTSVPVFHLWEHGLNDGLLGGKIIRHFAQGREAGEIARKILSGTDISTIKVNINSPNQIVLDYNILEEYGISSDSLPEDSIIINKPETLSDHIKRILEIYLSILILLIIFIIILGINIRKRIITEKKLRKSEETFKTLFNQSTHFAGLLSKNGVILKVNSTVLERYKIKESEVIGKEFWESPWLINSEYKHQIKAGLSRVTQGNPVKFITRTDTTDTQNAIIDFSAKPVLDHNSEVSEILVEGHDITQIKKYEARLNHVEKMESIGSLAGGIAHDFNNALGGIIGCAELLQDHTKFNPKAQSLLDMILNSSTKAADLTRKLLIFANKDDPIMHEINVHGVVDDSISILSHTIGKSIAIKTDLSAETDAVIGDPAQLESVFINLGLNSQYAMPEGGEIFISTSNISGSDLPYHNSNTENASEKYLKILFSDTGCGIKETEIKKIFEPFYTTKSIGEGTGLGLSAVYGIIKKHQGIINASSILGTGTVFTIFLPLAHNNSDRQ